MYRTVPTLIQGSDKWLEFRANKISATDAGYILGLMNPQWGNIYSLWVDKIFRRKKEANEAMLRGSRMEPLALAAYCEVKGIEFKPEVVVSTVREWQMASLDGLSECGQVVELKCPGENSHNLALMGHVPAYYKAQLQHIMSVLGVKTIDYASFRDDEIIIIPVKRDYEFIKKMLVEEEIFYDCLINIKEPENTQTIYEVVSTPAICASADRIKEARVRISELTAIIDHEKTFLTYFADGRNIKVNDMKITKRVRKGNIPYKLIPEINSIDLEKYRGKPTEFYSFS